MSKKKSAQAAPGAVFRHNAGRDPERLAMKYAAMARSPFVFLRGACHLFYDNLPDLDLLRSAPPAWACGDLHFENFGSYKGDNRLVYFDINDYDEAALAPASWDILRLLTSLICGAAVLGVSRAEALTASRDCIQAWCAALEAGKPLWVERETSTGLVRALLDGLQRRRRGAFLDKRTISARERPRQPRVRRLKTDGVKALPATASQKAAVGAFMRRFAAAQPNPKFYRVLDVARRVAGTGSLGLDRYVVLVEGKGSPDGNYLLDLKECKSSALLPQLARIGMRQPAWPDEGARVAGVQQRMQAVSHAFLHAVKFGGRPYLLRGLQPSEDRVAFVAAGGDPRQVHDLAATMGRILAWDQLRAAGRSGAAAADDLAAFAQQRGMAKALLKAAREMNTVTTAQWKAFRDSLKRVAVPVIPSSRR